MKHFDFQVRISYAETDRMGVIYYANYLVYFERGRTELLRANGMTYKDLEDKQHIYLPVMEAYVDYAAPGRYDDLLNIRTWVSELGGAHMSFRYEVTLANSEKLIASGRTKHPVVNADWKPVRIPRHLREALLPYLAEQ